MSRNMGLLAGGIVLRPRGHDLADSTAIAIGVSVVLVCAFP